MAEVAALDGWRESTISSVEDLKHHIRTLHEEAEGSNGGAESIKHLTAQLEALARMARSHVRWNIDRAEAEWNRETRPGFNVLRLILEGHKMRDTAKILNLSAAIPTVYALKALLICLERNPGLVPVCDGIECNSTRTTSVIKRMSPEQKIALLATIVEIEREHDAAAKSPTT
jgi:hypothetical protein